jgi:hypothetical protein
MSQIAADTLGLALGQVRVLHGSTPFLDGGYGAFASRLADQYLSRPRQKNPSGLARIHWPLRQTCPRKSRTAHLISFKS